MSIPANPDLVREIAERIDDGRRVNLPVLARDLDVEFDDLYEAYRELSRRRGHDPLLDRVYRHCDAMRRMARR